MKTSHHDTHAIPPQFIQEAYWHYNKIKTAELENDEELIDFGRGLSTEQKLLFKPVDMIKASTIESACRAFRDAALQTESDSPLRSVIQDVTVFEHVHFPGLQIAPSILPPETQVLFVSQVMHKYLADPRHKNNLEADYDIDFPARTPGDQSISTGPSDINDPTVAPLSSFFASATHDLLLRPKTTTTTTTSSTPLNSAQFLSKKLRWLTLGAQYDWPTRSYAPPVEQAAAFPSDLATLVSGLFPRTVAESGVCLLYSGKDFMPVHRDVSEECATGLASFSFGCDGVFVVGRGGEDGEIERTVALRVRSGDCVHMQGEARWAWHAMARTVAGTCPEWLERWPMLEEGAAEAERWTKEDKKAFAQWKGYMGRKRLNVSCRQVWD